jgi:DNA-binding transcriptional regulator YiaG
LNKNLQVLMRDGQPEYAVLPWDEYQALLLAAGLAQSSAHTPAPAVPAATPGQIRALREKLALSQEQLARNIGISAHYLALIEQGERLPDGAVGRALARALGVSGWDATA